MVLFRSDVGIATMLLRKLAIIGDHDTVLKSLIDDRLDGFALTLRLSLTVCLASHYHDGVIEGRLTLLLR